VRHVVRGSTYAVSRVSAAATRTETRVIESMSVTEGCAQRAVRPTLFVFR